MRWIPGAIVAVALSTGCAPGMAADVQAVDDAMRRICGVVRDGNAAPAAVPGWETSDRRGETGYFRTGDWGRADVRVMAGNGPTRCAIDLWLAKPPAQATSDAIHRVIGAVVAERYPEARLDKDRENGAGRGGFLITQWTTDTEYIGFAEFPPQALVPAVQVAWQWPV